MGIECFVGTERLVGNQWENHSRDRGEFQRRTDILERDSPGEPLEGRLHRQQDDHADRQHECHAFHSPENKTADQEGEHPGRTGREPGITSGAVAPLEEEGQPDRHRREARDEEERMDRLGEPGAENAEKSPEREGAEPGQHLCPVVAKLLIPLPLQADQRAKRAADKQALEQMIGIGGKHRQKG